MRKKLTPWFVLVALTLAACGGSGGGTTETTTPTPEKRQAMIDLVAGNVSTDAGAGELPVGDEGAGCLAERVVDNLGVARLEEFGYNVDTKAVPPAAIFKASLTEEEKSRTFSDLETCVDLPDLLSGLFASRTSWTPEQADCVAGLYVDSGVLERALFTTGNSLQLNRAIDAVLAESAEACAIPIDAPAETTTTAAP